MNAFFILYHLFMQPGILNRSREYVLALQEKRLRRMLQHAYKHSPFYRKFYTAHGINAASLSAIPLAELPPVDKQIFRDNFDTLFTDSRINMKSINAFLNKEGQNGNDFLGRYHIVHTSGSSGKPTYFVYDTESWSLVLATQFLAFKHNISFGRLLGYLKNGFRILFTGSIEDGSVDTSVIRAAGGNKLVRIRLLDINHPYEEWGRMVEEFAPNIIIGYPSSIHALCRQLEKHNIRLQMFRAACIGEPLTPVMRKYIISVLNCEIFSMYGSSEALLMGTELPGDPVLYLRDDLHCFEMERDCTYITPLYNYVQPLIRYRLSDVLVRRAEPVETGIPFMQLERVLGREEEMMWFTGDNGRRDFLHPLAVNDLTMPGLLQYQFYQESAASFVIRVVTEEGCVLPVLEKHFRETISPILAKKQLHNISYRIANVDALPAHPGTGKSKLVMKATHLS